MAMPINYINGLKGEASDLVIKHSFRSVAVNLTCSLPFGELAKLYRMIEAALSDKPNLVVQFVSAYKGEGASEIALETAITVARLMGKRVLFIDTAASLAAKPRKLPDSVAVSLDTLLLTGGSPYEAIAQAEGTELYFAMLRERGHDGLAPVSLTAIESALQSLRNNFGLIIVDSQELLTDAFGMALAKLVDGSVMVIEAERTRGLVALECKNLIEAGGGRLIGAVMNKRRLYIPKFLYRLFYQRRSV